MIFDFRLARGKGFGQFKLKQFQRDKITHSLYVWCRQETELSKAQVTGPDLMSEDMYREQMRQKWEAEQEEMLKNQDTVHYSNVKFDGMYILTYICQIVQNLFAVVE